MVIEQWEIFLMDLKEENLLYLRKIGRLIQWILNEIWNIKINIKIKMKNKDVYDILKSLEDEPEHNSHEGFNRSKYYINITLFYK